MNIGDEYGPDLPTNISNSKIEGAYALTAIESILLRGSSIVGNLQTGSPLSRILEEVDI